MPHHFAGLSALGLAALGLSALGLPARAQPSEPAFTTAEAADCGVVFLRMTEALRSGAEAPQPFVAQVALGLAIWEYELNAAAPGDEEATKAAVTAAVERLEENIPGEDADPGARGDYLMAEAGECGGKIDAAYPEASHPVIERIREMAAEQQRAAEEDGNAP